MAALADGTEIVVAEAQDAPSELGVKNAVSIVQSLAYLEPRARQLLIGFIDSRDDWRLTTIDFGAEAARHGCEFLMCFVLNASSTDIARASLYVEIGFTLNLPLADTSTSHPLAPSPDPAVCHSPLFERSAGFLWSRWPGLPAAMQAYTAPCASTYSAYSEWLLAM